MKDSNFQLKLAINMSRKILNYIKIVKSSGGQARKTIKKGRLKLVCMVGLALNQEFSKQEISENNAHLNISQFRGDLEPLNEEIPRPDFSLLER